jgi:ABC-type Fe3+ transport system permease subunit
MTNSQLAALLFPAIPAVLAGITVFIVRKRLGKRNTERLHRDTMIHAIEGHRVSNLVMALQDAEATIHRVQRELAN